VCVSDVSEQHWVGRRESTGPTPGEAQQHHNVGLGMCVTAILFEHAQEMLVCWQCGVNDDHVVECVSDVRQQHWGGRRESTGPTPGEAQQDDNVALVGCVTAIVFEHAQEILVCWQCGVNDDHVFGRSGHLNQAMWCLHSQVMAWRHGIRGF